MVRRKTLFGAALIGLTVLTVSAGLAWANHVRIEIIGGTQQPASPGVIYAPSAEPTVVVPAPSPLPPTLQADEVKAHQVRARTIYANKIEADEIQGVIHQTRGIKISDTHGDIKAPEVSVSVIYADKITANFVAADAVYVRDLRRR